MRRKKLLPFLTGPTACGKKEISVALAEALNAEIISMDSMKVYRGMDIGTAKPSPEMLRRVPHHLIDLVCPDEPFSVGLYRKFAMEAVSEIISRGKVPLFVGGTPLYLRAIRQGLFEGPPAEPSIRKRLHALASTEGTVELHRRLSKVDPRAASRIHPNDLKRLVRALEVFELTGTPISELQEASRSEAAGFESVVVVLRRGKDDLRGRIIRRVERMFRAGLVEEVRGLLSRYNLTAEVRRAVAYREVIAYIEGKIGLEEAKTLISRHTWQIARRQMTWFRSIKDAHPVGVPESADLEHILPEVLRAMQP